MSTVENTATDAEWARAIGGDLKREMRVGGDIANLPCPFCELPRSQRSDYVRCQKCGVNWLPGEDLSRDPRIERFTKMMANQPKAKSEK